MIKRFELREGTLLTEQEKSLLEEAGRRPICYDNDSPELTGEMEEGFRAARKAKPYRKEL